MADRKLTVRIIGDDSSLSRAFTRSSHAGKRFESDLGKTTRGVLAATVSMRGLGRALTFGSAQFLGGAGVAFAFKQIVTEASRVQEEIEKTGVVFGRNAGQVQAWSKTLAQSFGVSEGAALQAAGTFGNMLRPLGFGEQAAAAMSERLVELAADVASFNNIKPAEALQAISSGLAGQVRPLRQFGVFLSAARIQTEAVSDGIARQGAKLTQAQKVQAAYNIILKDTRLQQGDVARNTGSLSVAMSKLTAGVQDLEAGLGTALLPTLTEYVNEAAAWLNQTKNQQRIQHDFEAALTGTVSVLKTVKTVIHDVDEVTGSFKNTLELLLALKVASVVTRWAASLGLFAAAETAANEAAVVTRIREYTSGIAAAGSAAAVSTTKMTALRGALLRLGALGVIAIGVEIILNKDKIDKTVSGFLDKHGLGSIGSNQIKGINLGNIDKAIANAQKFNNDFTEKALEKYKQFLVSQDAKRATLLKATVGLGPHHDTSFDASIAAATTAAASQSSPTKRTGISSSQRNTFFDNQIARILQRGGLGTISQQIGALQKADSLIQARLKVTKDVTRRLNLEDELLQNAAQIKDLQGQQAADALQKKQDARDKALAALQAKQEARARALANLTAKQFRQLGLTATGDQPTPGVANLKKQLASLTKRITGTSLDTPKLEAQLARFRKVLSQGLVPKDVRSKIAEMFAEIRSGFDQGLGKHTGQLTKFAHVNASALVNSLGLNLTADQKRKLESAISQIGAGGTVPGVRSQAFSGSGAKTVVHTHVNLDGREIAKVVTPIQQRAGQRRSESRRGPYAGRH